MSQAPWYTQEETEYIREHYYKTPIDDMAKHLGRTPMSIKLKASKMGITRPRGWNAAGHHMNTIDAGIYRDQAELEPMTLKTFLDNFERRHNFTPREETFRHEELAEVYF